MKIKILLLLLFISYVVADSAPQNVEIIDYVVIGAGPAGIYAANTFAKAGKSCVTLEARNRIGGRVDTRFVNGYSSPVEMGASFVHDANISPWPAVAQEAGHELRLWDAYNIQFIEDGKRLNQQAYNEILGEFDYYWTAHFNYSQLGRSDREALFLAGYTVPQRRIEAVLNAIETVPAISMEEHDSTGWNPYPEEELGVEYIVPGGYKQLLEYVLYNYSSAAQGLRLQSEVRKIDYSDPQGSVLITYKNLATNKIKYIRATKGVVMTLPIGVLKSCAVEFNPPLPRQFQYSVNKVSFGNCMKVALFFDQKALNQMKRDQANWWWDIPDQPTTDDIVIFWNYGYVYNQPIIQSFFCGDYSIIMESLGDSQIVNIHMRKLRQFLPKLPDPLRYIISRWHSDPYSRGVYADYSLGTTPEDFSEFLEPLGRKGTLVYRGEASGTWTDTICFDQGTTNQAATAGRWGAEYLLSLETGIPPQYTCGIF